MGVGPDPHSFTHSSHPRPRSPPVRTVCTVFIYWRRRFRPSVCSPRACVHIYVHRERERECVCVGNFFSIAPSERLGNKQENFNMGIYGCFQVLITFLNAFQIECFFRARHTSLYVSCTYPLALTVPMWVLTPCCFVHKIRGNRGPTPLHSHPYFAHVHYPDNTQVPKTPSCCCRLFKKAATLNCHKERYSPPIAP